MCVCNYTIFIIIFFNYIFLQNMSQFQSYSASKGPVSVASPMDCSITEYLPTTSDGNLSASRHKQNADPFQIDYSRFINEISSKRQPSQLREISNYNDHIIAVVIQLRFYTHRIVVQTKTSPRSNLRRRQCDLRYVKKGFLFFFLMKI